MHVPWPFWKRVSIMSVVTVILLLLLTSHRPFSRPSAERDWDDNDLQLPNGLLHDPPPLNCSLLSHGVIAPFECMQRAA